jgi:hypothetical protein
MRRAVLGLLSVICIASTVAPVGAAAPDDAFTSSCEPTADGYRCTAGPFEVGAGERVETITGVAAPPEPGYITSGQATLVDGDGDEVSHHMVHLHHAVWLNPAREDLTCESYAGGLAPNYDRFFATGKERTKVVLPAGYGYHWSNESPPEYAGYDPFWALVAHLDGMHGGSDVYIQFDVGFVPDAAATGIIDARPVWLDVRNCSVDPVFTVAKGSGAHGKFRERWDYTMPLGGNFVFMGGHMHDGGLKLKLRNVTGGKSVFTSTVAYGRKKEPWYLTSMSTFSGVPGMDVAAGDELRLTAVYDSTHEWEDVMGIMVGMLVP